MFRNYFTIAFRNLRKNKIYSLINIFGLAVGMAACFFIFQYVHFESGYDRFNENADRLFRVPISYTGSMSSVPITASNHPAVGPAMKKEFPEVEDFTRLVNISTFATSFYLSYKPEHQVPRIFSELGVFVADGSFFNLFSYPLISGDRRTCLVQPKSIVISESMSRKYFGTANALGKALNFNSDGLLTVTGVFKDIPDNSHIKFTGLLSFSTIGKEWGYDEWRYPEFYNYVLLRKGADVAAVKKRLPGLVTKYLGQTMKELNFACALELQPVTDIHLKSNYHKEAEANGSAREVSMLSIIGLFILVIAWVNYINLATAKSMERAKEVGLRKAVGAERRQLIFQFLLESVIINFLALIIATGIVLSCIPLFRQLLGKDINAGFFSSGLGGEAYFWVMVAGIFLAGALLVGAYPALVIASFKPALVLKGVMVTSTSGISLRRVLVTLQFVLSIVLIAATLIVTSQLSFMRNGNLGYQKEQMLILKAPPVFDSSSQVKFQYFNATLRQNSSVAEVTATSDIPGQTINYRNSVRNIFEDKTSNFTSYLLEIDDHFVDTYKVPMVAGRKFSSTDTCSMAPGSRPKVMINEVTTAALGFKNPEAAVNQDIVLKLGEHEYTCQVVGVMKNFHQRSMREKYDPILCYFPRYSSMRYVAININSTNIQSTLASVETLFKTSFSAAPFEYFFLDDFFNKQYQADQRLGKVFGLFAGLAIIISCLGLLGLSSFIVNLRRREIGIRKVLGATVSSILVLFSRDFVKLVVIASVICLPIIYFGAQQWLDNFAFHIGVSWVLLIVPPLFLLAISLFTVSIQSMKAALTNPTKSLRSE